MSAEQRFILVVSHAAQQATLEAAVQVCREIQAQGAIPVLRELEVATGQRTCTRTHYSGHSRQGRHCHTD